MAFPAPVGGYYLASDFPPSVVFAALYGLLVPLMAYRMCRKDSRTALLIGSAGFLVERTVMFCLRARVAHSHAYSEPLIEYLQVSMGVGFITLAQDLANLLRCLLVNATYARAAPAGAPTLVSRPSDWRAGSLWRRPATPDAAAEALWASAGADLPRQRFWARRLCDAVVLGFVAALVPGFIGSSFFCAGMYSERKGFYVMWLRYVSGVLALVLIVVTGVAALWALVRLPRADRRAAALLVAFSVLLGITGAYRLAVMRTATHSLTELSAAAQNTPASKALFYILHIVPEWVVSAALFGVNIRAVFSVDAREQEGQTADGYEASIEKGKA